MGSEQDLLVITERGMQTMDRNSLQRIAFRMQHRIKELAIENECKNREIAVLERQLRRRILPRLFGG